jgi:RNA polymerase-binding protein DksA
LRASKITICEGAAAMVAKKSAARKAVPAKDGTGAGSEAGAVSGGAGPGTPPVQQEAAATAAAGRTAPVSKTAAAREKTGAGPVVAKKSAGGSRSRGAPAKDAATGVPTARTAVPPGELPVRPGEDPWTPEEVAEARTELLTETERLRSEILSSENAVAGLMRDSGTGAGDDEADTGTKNITREHEMSLAANAREMLEQTGRALERLDAGTYGLCEHCGKAIGKARMQAFPRATLCVDCKQKQERRS